MGTRALRIGVGMAVWLTATSLAADPAEEARAAMAQLDAAYLQLDDAASARDRVAALTQTVQAFEDGLSAVRTGLRAAVQREDALTRDLAGKEAEVARLVGVLQVMGNTSTPRILLHPEGPTGAARSGMILSDVTPALQAEVDRLRSQLAEVETLRTLQQDAGQTLRDGLIGVQNARATLAQAIADRGPLPQRFTEDPVKTALLIAASETLDGFASGLTDITPDGVSASLPSAARIEGTLDWPVNGTLLRQFREADAAGVARPGLILATRANALVTSPAAATVRFQGDLLDYGNVMILEPARDVLVVLAGLEDVYVSTGDVVTTGAPIGLMGGTAPDAASGVSERTQTLYIEIRDDQEPVDPAGWFTTRGN